MMTPWNPHAVVEDLFSKKLNDEPWFKAHRVTIVEENHGDFATLMKQNLAQIGGVVLVVSVEEITNVETGVAAEVNVVLTATEGVPINRARNDFATAMDVAQAAIQCLADEWWRWDRCEHDSPAEGVLQARVYFKGMVSIIHPADPTEQDAKLKGDD